MPDYTPEGEWRRQTDAVREHVHREFPGIHLLADSLDMGRTGAGGFDGIAVYDNFVEPDIWLTLAADASAVGLTFSFNVNAGYDGYVLRDVQANSCYQQHRSPPGARTPTGAMRQAALWRTPWRSAA